MRNLLLGLEFSFVDVALLFSYMVPSFMMLVLPISCMVSVFLTFLRMSTDRELVALKAGGISIYQLLRAPALFSFTCMLLGLFISLHAVAWGMDNFRATVLHIAQTRAKVVVQPGVFNRDILGLTLFARKVDPDTGHLQQVIFEDTTQSKDISVTVLAPEGTITTDERAGDLVFDLKDGRIYRVHDENVSILNFDRYVVRVDLNQAVQGIIKSFSDVRPKDMSWHELVKLNRQPDPDSKDTYRNRVEVEIQKRWALPVSCLILGIFALPLACAFEGVRRQMGVVVALLLFLSYYALFSLGMSTGESGLLSPYVSVWLANALFSLAAVWGLYLVNRERAPSPRWLMASLRKFAIRRFRRERGTP